MHWLLALQSGINPKFFKQKVFVSITNRDEAAKTAFGCCGIGATALGRVDKNRGKLESVRPFEPQTERPRIAGVINRNQFLKKTGSQVIDMDGNYLALLWSNSINFSVGLLKKRPDAFTVVEAPSSLFIF